MKSGSRPNASTHDVATPMAQWRFGHVRFDERSLTLWVRGSIVEAPKKSLEVLRELLLHAGEVVTKDELAESCWPRRILSEGVLTTTIGRLRQALGPEESAAIETVHGHGYRLAAPVSFDGPEPAAAPRLRLSAGDHPPGRPDWVLTEPRGAGGQADVWLGRTDDPAMAPRVFKFALDLRSVSALRRELAISRLLQEVSGDLSAAGFVPVLDGQFTQLPAFIANEWIPAGNLEEWAQMRGGLAGLPLELRLDLAAQCAESLAIAHGAGVLHKDLKPANVLIDDRGPAPRIRLADFGSATVLDRERLRSYAMTQLGLTQAAGQIDSSSGTPLYMAPEVLAGQATTERSDLYSLGILLYQLVVGDFRRPLSAGWEVEVPDELLREDIALAAAGDPLRRLSNAAELARRLRSLPARREQRASERRDALRAAALQKDLERHRQRRPWVIVVGGLLAAGLVVASVLGWNLNKALGEAQRQTQLATREASRANAVAAFLTDDVFNAANPLLAKRRDISAQELLDSAQARLDERFKDQPRELATLQRVIGSAYAGLGNRQAAERLLIQAEQGLIQQVGISDPETQAARVALRDLYVYLRDYPYVFPVLARILEAERAAGRTDTELALGSEGYLAVMQCIAGYLNEYVARCDEFYDKAVRKAAELTGERSTPSLHARYTAALGRSRDGRHAEALAMVRKLQADVPPGLDPDSFWGWQIVSQRAVAEAYAGEPAQARAIVAEWTAQALRLFGPGSRQYRVARRFHAITSLRLGQKTEAVAELKEVRALWLADPAGGLVDYADLLKNLAQALRETGKPAEAEEALGDGLARMAATEKPTGYLTMILRDAMADARADQQDRAGAERLLRQNLEEARGLFRKGEWLLGWCVYRLGAHLAADGRIADAAPLLSEAVTILEASIGTRDSRTQEARERLRSASAVAAQNS